MKMTSSSQKNYKIHFIVWYKTNACSSNSPTILLKIVYLNDLMNTAQPHANVKTADENVQW